MIDRPAQIRHGWYYEMLQRAAKMCGFLYGYPGRCCSCSGIISRTSSQYTTEVRVWIYAPIYINTCDAQYCRQVGAQRVGAAIVAARANDL